jgi:tRNA pseudouridine13 synthase
LEHFQAVRVDGTRRLGRLLIPDLRCTANDNELVVEFFLPKGAFATTVLRELMKVELSTEAELDGDDVT